MKQYIKLLGKVCATADGDWDNTREYERLCIVRDASTMKTYISKMFVPKDVDILDTKYWQYLSNGAIINNLTSTDAEAALSANMGRYLKSLLDELATKEANDIKNLTNKHNQDITTVNNTINNVKNNLQQSIDNLNNATDGIITDLGELEDEISAVDKKHGQDVAALQKKIDDIVEIDIQVVTNLPTTGVKGVIYFVRNQSSTDNNNIYTEYVWVSSTSKYEILGQFKSEPDLSNYQPKLESGVNIKTINNKSILGEGNINTPVGSVVSFTRSYSSGTKIGTITIDGTATDIYIPIWTGTKAQYDAIATKDPNITYNIIDA